MTEITTENRTASTGHNGGIQYIYEFPNGYGASVIQSQYSYGGDVGLWEIAVLDSEGHLTYTTPVTDDVIGRLDEAEINEQLALIAALPDAA